ncbi:MAG: hypothetical protein ACTTHI_04290 [Prevotella sp.]
MPTTQIIIIAVFIVVAFSFSFLYSKFFSVKGYTKEDLDNRIKNTSEQEIKEFYTSEMGDYIKHLNGKKPIAASCLFHAPDTKEHMKNGAKNYLRGLLTLGMVKFRTVYVATPLFLAEDGLHVIELDKDDEVKNHYLFDNDRLANAKIFPKDDQAASKQLGENAAFFTLSIPSESGTRELELCTEFYPTQEKYMQYTFNKKLIAAATGRHFLKKLGEHFSNLQVRF